MRAATIVDGHIELREHPTPGPLTADDVLVRVAGAGLNRADLLQRIGLYPPPPGSPVDIPGMEFAGTVEAVGANVTTLAVGDPVFGVVGGGGQGEELVTRADHCARVPDGLDLVAMGGVPETFVTAHDALVTQAALQPDEWVLVHAVGSGVGTSALQLAKALGAKVVGTARTPDKLERARALGLDHGIVAPTTTDGELDIPALVAEIVAVTGGGVDVAIELVGGPYVEADIAAAARLGRIVLVGTLAGGRATLDVLTTMQRRLRVHGTVLRTRTDAEKAAATSAFARDVVPLLASGRLEPIVERVLPLAQAEAGYELLASNATFGKVILDCH
jgi:NADPH:quinone reductase-like Zn-dependent oxidoreductase